MLKLLNCLSMTIAMAYGVWMTADSEGFMNMYGTAFEVLDANGKAMVLYIVRWWALALLSFSFAGMAVVFGKDDATNRLMGQFSLLSWILYLFTDTSMLTFKVGGKGFAIEGVYFNMCLHGTFLVGYVYALYVAGELKGGGKKKGN